MSKTIVLDDVTAELLDKLAREEDTTPEALIAEMTKKRDSDKHVEWVPGKGHVRVRCNSKKCFETPPRHPNARD
jgi:hypothetical protein